MRKWNFSQFFSAKGGVKFGVKFWWNFPCCVFQGLGVRRKISPKFHVKNGKFHANFTLLGRSADISDPPIPPQKLYNIDFLWIFLGKSRFKFGAFRTFCPVFLSRNRQKYKTKWIFGGGGGAVGVRHWRRSRYRTKSAVTLAQFRGASQAELPI